MAMGGRPTKVYILFIGKLVWLQTTPRHTDITDITDVTDRKVGMAPDQSAGPVCIQFQ